MNLLIKLLNKFITYKLLIHSSINELISLLRITIVCWPIERQKNISNQLET